MTLHFFNRYLLGVLPSSVRDLLRDLDQFDPARARYYRHVRLLADVNELSLTVHNIFLVVVYFNVCCSDGRWLAGDQ